MKSLISTLRQVLKFWIHGDKWILVLIKMHQLEYLRMCPIIGYMDSWIYVNTGVQNGIVNFRMRECLKFLDLCGLLDT